MPHNDFIEVGVVDVGDNRNIATGYIAKLSIVAIVPAPGDRSIVHLANGATMLINERPKKFFQRMHDVAQAAA